MNCILLDKNSDHITNVTQITHIKSILKLAIGDTLTVAEIGGKIGRATIASIDDDKIALTDKQLTNSPPKKLDVTVILALPRPKVLRRLIMDMTALGVNKIILINSYRTQKSYWQSPLLNRLDEFIIEGLQQAVDSTPPTIEIQKRFKPFVEDDFGKLLDNSHSQAIIAHPYATDSWQNYLQSHKSTMPKVICIGAEGGWIDYEVELLQTHGCTAVSLGNRILRTEAVVNVMLGSWFSQNY